MILCRQALSKTLLNTPYKTRSFALIPKAALIRPQLAHHRLDQHSIPFANYLRASMSTAPDIVSIPKTRSLSDFDNDGDIPAAKKPRLENENVTEAESMDVEKPDAPTVVVELEGLEGGSKSTNGTGNANGKAKQQKSHKKKDKKKKDPPLPEPCSPSDVLYQEIRELLGADVVDAVTAGGEAFKSPFEKGEEVEVDIEFIGSGGSGVARAPSSKGPWAIVVPCTVQKEKVKVKIAWNERMHSTANIVEVITPNTELRDDSRVQCKYFGTCGGCQYQMLSSETQLDLKRNVIVKAYKTYSNLPESSIPTIESTVESPLLYNYRTKLTPHFERAPKYAKKADNEGGKQPDWLKIGFNVLNVNMTMDIEECPIATANINQKYKEDRKEIVKNIFNYKKGVSLMYRDSLDTSFDAEKMMEPPVDKLSEAFTKQVCVSNQKAQARELVGDYLFEYEAGGFFQNNNSVLPLLVDYVKSHIRSSQEELEKASQPPLTHLVDTYCGAGLFAITLSSLFEKVAGIELSASSIASAKRNATLNHIPSSKISFQSGDAFNIFATVASFPANQTAIVIDPPRKGCDEPFIKQLVGFRPKVVVYVSCNVHTQARDIGDIIRRTEGDGEGRRYRMEVLRGFDLFPQTAHVEGVALLRLY
ncbi:S-adenosyl-L-methionine-dependent methyltransferase [Panaeolus papilionaceus]|nr:S-adenosyl-L-methionine-dependent methyltransferase [Panaeolus papilionaceus]